MILPGQARPGGLIRRLLGDGVSGRWERARGYWRAFIWKKETAAILLSVYLLVLTPFFFCPARISVGNFMELSFSFPQSALFFLASSAILILLISAAVLLRVRRPRTLRILVAAFCASGFLMWLQGNVLLWQYGVLNGKDIPWGSLIHLGIIDSILWALFLAFALWRSDLVFRFSRQVCGFILLIQVITFFQGWISMPKDQDFKQQQPSASSLFTFSRHRNVIIMVLDTFQSDIFQDIVSGNDGLRSSFNGFTYFRNALAGSDGTSVSIPHMLTARNYDNSVPYLDFIKSSFLGNSLPKTLKEYSFTVDMDPIIPYSIYADFNGVPLQRRRLMNWGAFLKEQAFVTDLALFRSLPHFIKKGVYNGQKWLLSGLVARRQEAEAEKEEARTKEEATRNGKKDASKKAYTGPYARELANAQKVARQNRDANFIRKMVSSSTSRDGADAFKFYHLNGVHLQLIMNEKLEYEYQPPGRDGMVRQGTGILKIAAIFLERLKALGAYDNSLIFIVGDHGAGLEDTGINNTEYGTRFNRKGPYKGCFQNFKSAGIPLVLVKRIGASGALRTSDAPVSLGDIPRTVADELGLRAEFPGKSMFKVRKNEKRERIYRAFVGSQEDVRHLAPLYEYSVSGFSWDDASWMETGNVYYARKK